MNLYTEQNIQAEALQMFDKKGEANVVVVIKQSFSIPLSSNEKPKKLKKNWSFFYEDTYVGEPGLSPILFENDFVLRKQKCDIVVNAKAYKPRINRDKDKFIASFQVGKCIKKAEVKLSHNSGSEQAPVWLHYGSTWGGTWEKENHDPEIFLSNPIGQGYIPKEYQIIPQSLKLPPVLYPNSRENEIDTDKLEPCAFTTLARNFSTRLDYAGSYDDNWYNNVFPLLPPDFDERFFQCVPEDQQISYPTGGETVKFINLHPTQSVIEFELPNLEIPVILQDKNLKLHHLTPIIDTLQFDLEKQEFSIVWRCHQKLQHSLKEIKSILVGIIDQKKIYELLGDDEN